MIGQNKVLTELLDDLRPYYTTTKVLEVDGRLKKQQQK